MRRLLLTLIGFGLALGLVISGAAAWWLHQPIAFASPKLDLSIEPGTTPRGVAQALVEAGAQTRADALFWWFRLSGQSRLIKAGNYEIEPGTTPRQLLGKLVRGEESLRALTLVEGWTFRQVREALAKTEYLRADTQTASDDAVMSLLGKPGLHPEGRFFPDTYNFAKGASDLSVLRRAMLAMDKKLAAAWSQRAPDVPLQTPDQALILASIVEKETGKASDQAQIAGVFANRLRKGMLLQTDPTVIYGLGAAFDGNLRKRDLLADTPWNTYTRSGLPPTPIAMPGLQALRAAVRPAVTQALYFVARGDGSSQFSATLDEHNRAVNRYQRGR
ncbi:MAG: endolytic transglycosylase MltG [Burkholderiaceae bacterium]